jgi:hypothetical protein
VIRNLGKDQAEYLAVLSAHSDVSMWLLFGLSPAERTVGADMPVNVALVDHKPVTGAVVTVTIPMGNQEYELLRLYDDGAHKDGEADDGLYGNTYHLSRPGSYTVKAVAEGHDNQGDPFTRYATRSFYVRPRLLYIYNGAEPVDVAASYGYEGLLEDVGFAVDRIEMGDVATTPLAAYEYAIVGPEARPFSRAAVVALQDMPVLGLGKGGYEYFGQLGLAIGEPYGRSGEETGVVAVNWSAPVWNEPYPIPRARITPLYMHTVHVGVKPPAGVAVTLIGREPYDTEHYVIAEQYDDRSYILWGFAGPPEDMTETGKQLFANVAWYLE